MGPPDEAAVAAKLPELRAEMKVLDDHLATREWLATGRLTLADLSLGASLTWAADANLPWADFPHLAAWFERVRALPAWVATDPTRG
jgi:glutathione S-transferase